MKSIIGRHTTNIDWIGDSLCGLIIRLRNDGGKAQPLWHDNGSKTGLVENCHKDPGIGRVTDRWFSSRTKESMGKNLAVVNKDLEYSTWTIVTSAIFWEWYLLIPYKMKISMLACSVPVAVGPCRLSRHPHFHLMGNHSPKEFQLLVHSQ